MNYLVGLGNHLETEALEGALPTTQNSPQRVAYGLYAEQITGSAFTAPRPENLKTWFYRMQPAVVQGKFEEWKGGGAHWHSEFRRFPVSPNALRWDPFPLGQDFLGHISTYCGNGDLEAKKGLAIHHYSFQRSMTDTYFYDADAELMFVPWKGETVLKTECGILQFSPGEIAVVPRGIKFQVTLGGSSKEVAGYLCENFGLPFRLPGLGPIGANGLANPRHFQFPVAWYEEKKGPCTLVCRFFGSLWSAPLPDSPLNVVAWQGNYAPYKYDLRLFNTFNTVSFDHPDPSIFTVLTSPSEIPGTSNIDFVIFPARWMVAENTFRPPYYHRNTMSEFMGLIYGVYDAKPQGFVPGGASLHNCMQAHGPDAETFEAASNKDLKPEFYKNTLAFMFESCLPYRTTPFALSTPFMQKNYMDCWSGLKNNFDPKKK